MGQHRGHQAQQQDSKGDGQQREGLAGKRTEDPVEAVQEVLGTRAASRQVRVGCQPGQAGEGKPVSPMHSLLQSMTIASLRSQGKPSFRGVSQEWGGGASRLVVQPKLMIGEPNDRYEQEADRVAKQVVQQVQSPPVAQGSAGVEVQRLTDEDKAELQRKSESLLLGEPVGGMAASADLEASIRQARGGGVPLPETVREPMERAFGADFSGVRIHDNAQADALNRSISAKAFTTEQDVFFRQGEYKPGNRGGLELIAHELTHVVQQTNGSKGKLYERIPDSVVMRKEEGLAAPSANLIFAVEAHNIWHDQKGAPIETLINHLMAIANRLLKTKVDKNCPDMKLGTPNGNDYGAFFAPDWTLKINAAKLTEGGRKTVEQLSVEEVAELVDTFNHETRHAEQWYRIARKMSIEGGEKETIIKQTGLPSDVVEAATKSDKPMTPEMTKKI